MIFTIRARARAARFSPCPAARPKMEDRMTTMAIWLSQAPTLADAVAILRAHDRRYGTRHAEPHLADCWPGCFEPQWEAQELEPWKLRSVWFSIGTAGALLMDRAGSTRESAIEISGVPECVPAAEVRRVLGGLVLWPWPRRLAWAIIYSD